MKVWEEEEVLRELVTARMATAAVANSNQPNKNAGVCSKWSASPSYSDQRTQLNFLLILVRKVQRNINNDRNGSGNCYEFNYFPAETYERIDAVFQHTMVETEDRAEEEEAATSSCEKEQRPWEPYFVGKAIFHTASGETLLKIQASRGWTEALKRNYHALDVRCKARVDRLVVEQRQERNQNIVAASAAIAGGTVTSLAMGSGVMATEAAVTGGLTATLQTIGAVGVMASPMGVGLAAAGAIGGTYYWIQRRNKARRREEEESQRKQQLEQMAHQLVTAEPMSIESSGSSGNDYQRLSKDDPSEQLLLQADDIVDLWVLVSAKRLAMEESEHCWDHHAWEDRVDADQAFLEVTGNTVAKALFDPHGVLRRIDCDPSDRDGWETALTLHFNHLVEQKLITAGVDPNKEENSRENTPLLREEEAL